MLLPEPDYQTEAQCFSPVRLFVHLFYQTCERDILETNEPILMPVGTSGPRGNRKKRSNLRVRRSSVEVTGGRR